MLPRLVSPGRSQPAITSRPTSSAGQSACPRGSDRRGEVHAPDRRRGPRHDTRRIAPTRRGRAGALAPQDRPRGQMAAADYESEREFRRIWHTYIDHVAAPKGAEWISTGPAPDPATGTPGQAAKRAGDRDRPPGWPGPRQRCGDARSPGRPAHQQSGPSGQPRGKPAGPCPSPRKGARPSCRARQPLAPW